MDAGIGLKEYLSEIRRQVCAHCVERPTGGPPCAPLGKKCGIEAELRRLIDAVHRVPTGGVDAYIKQFEGDVCAYCPNQGTEHCPCPLQHLLLLAVQAIEDVDQQRADIMRSVDA